MPAIGWSLLHPNVGDCNAVCALEACVPRMFAARKSILALADGDGVRGTAAALGCNTTYVERWNARFRTGRHSGLAAQHKGRTAGKAVGRLGARILEWTRLGSDDGSTHWISRRLAAKLKTTHIMVARVWRRHGLQPHRLRHHMASDDPDFESKAADIIGLYLQPPAHASVFCVD